MSSKRFRVCLGVSAETNSGGVALQEIDTKGLKFLNSSGQEVQLRGVNLGGWLVDEIWMTPWVAQSGDRKINDHVSLTALLKKRFGEAGMARVRDSWRANWITADDFRRIHDLGFNSVRLPFLCDILTEPGGLDVLRRAVAEAKAAGL